ncbi:TRAP transporter large permease [Aminobacter sp. AP02]|uniref:TRAP transporter large permease n=1 Tax=Aminobacter sp. AP02 TaxID=2135737 RepID=UPI000D6A86BE|nr:TRAP transporter large permease [Aminobacter sp. AP02]PWK60796.1 tripartite ATP-independent transporter DctM subunit [Aminobacter sp. AP02]
MDTNLVIGVGFGLMLLLCALRVPIGLAMGSAGMVGFGLLTGFAPAFKLVSHSVITTFSDYTMGLIPLFVLMGAVVVASGISANMFRAAQAWFGGFRGGLATATIAACGGFAAICGSSAATAATMTRIGLPEMRKYGYSDRLATGVIAAGGTLGILIPPSIALAIYGLITQQSIGLLFMAAIVPGLFAVLFYMLTVRIWIWRRPQDAPTGQPTPMRERVSSLSKLSPMLLLIILVIGGIYGGLFTPTEAGAIGAAGAIVISFTMGSFSGKRLVEALIESVHTGAAIITILAGAMLFGYFLTITQTPQKISVLLMEANLGAYGTLAVILLVMLLLGCIMDATAVVLITVPIVYPIITQLGFDPIWFGVVVTMTVEIGMISPPFGLNVFVIKGLSRQTDIWEIYKGVTPFIIADILRIILVCAFPALVMFLPNLVN